MKFSVRWMIGVLREALRRFADDDHAVYAGHMAFTLLLSFGPFVVCSILLASYVDPEASSRLIGMIASLKDSALIPAPMAELFIGVVEGVAPRAEHLPEKPGQWWLIWVTAGVGLYAGSSAFEAARNGFNEAYDVRDKRHVVYRRMQSHLFALFIATLFVVISFTFVTASIGFQTVQAAGAVDAAADMAASIGLDGATASLLLLGGIVIVVALLFWALLLGIHVTLPRGYVKGWALYVWAADEIEDKRAVRVPLMPGVRASAVMWLLFAIGYSVVIGSVVDFGTNHGALAGVVATLLFFYISASIIFFGAQINIAIATVDDRGQPAWPHPFVERAPGFDESAQPAYKVLTEPHPATLTAQLWHLICGGGSRIKDGPEEIVASFRRQIEERKAARSGFFGSARKSRDLG